MSSCFHVTKAFHLHLMQPSCWRHARQLLLIHCRNWRSTNMTFVVTRARPHNTPSNNRQNQFCWLSARLRLADASFCQLTGRRNRQCSSNVQETTSNAPTPPFSRSLLCTRARVTVISRLSALVATRIVPLRCHRRRRRDGGGNALARDSTVMNPINYACKQLNARLTHLLMTQRNRDMHRFIVCVGF